MASEGEWWLKAGDRIYGAYALPDLADYLRQGRLAGSSLLGDDPEGPFAPAATWPALARLFEPTREAVVPSRETQPEAPSPAAARPLLVLAALRDTAPETVEAALLTFGPCIRVKGALWLSRARLPAAGLRNALSRRLGPAEFLLVVEADLTSAAWFNLDGDIDRALRRLWGEKTS